MRFKNTSYFILLSIIPTLIHAGAPLFKIQLALGETAFPNNIGWYDPPITRFVSVTNQSGVAMPLTYLIAPPYQVAKTQ